MSCVLRFTNYPNAYVAHVRLGKDELRKLSADASEIFFIISDDCC